MLVQMTIIYLFISFVLVAHMIKEKHDKRKKNNKVKDNVIQVQIDDDVDIEIDPSSLVDTNGINDSVEESNDLVNIKEGNNLFKDKETKRNKRISSTQNGVRNNAFINGFNEAINDIDDAMDDIDRAMREFDYAMSEYNFNIIVNSPFRSSWAEARQNMICESTRINNILRRYSHIVVT